MITTELTTDIEPAQAWNWENFQIRWHRDQCVILRLDGEIVGVLFFDTDTGKLMYTTSSPFSGNPDAEALVAECVTKMFDRVFFETNMTQLIGEVDQTNKAGKRTGLRNMGVEPESDDHGGTVFIMTRENWMEYRRRLGYAKSDTNSNL